MKFFPFFRKSESQVLDEAERTFRRNPSLEEVKRHLDRELTHRFSRQFDLIKEATQEISRRTEAGTIDEESAKAAKGQMALQAAQAFKVQKAEALKSYEEGDRHCGTQSWEAAIQAFSRALEHSSIAPFHLALANAGIRIAPDHPAASHYQDAIGIYRTLPEEKEGLGTALCQAALYEWKKGERNAARSLLEEALPIFESLRDRKKVSLIKGLHRSVT